jgi:photosystem II stability/assembly factor-like uncharacterized protein
MNFIQLPFFYCVLSFLSFFPGLEYAPSSSKKSVDSAHIEPTNVILQSKDGGATWQDISSSLPGNEVPEDFFAAESDIYVRINNETYRSKSNLMAPVWEKEKAFVNHSAAAQKYEGEFLRNHLSKENGLPIYPTLKQHLVYSVLETSVGAILVGSETGLYKSVDGGQNWKRVVSEGWVRDVVESEGVLLGESQKGIMRSTDNGEHWDWVISEGGVGIDVEPIIGGFAAIAYNTSMMSRRIHISLDNGKTWKAIDQGLRPSLSLSSVKQIGKYLICGHPDGIFRSSDMGISWTLVHSTGGLPFSKPADSRVFSIYSSGYVLYAVLKNSGC